MSDEVYRPTLTYPNGAYSATQVRLYGLLPDSMPCGILHPAKKPIFNFKKEGIQVTVGLTSGNPDLDAALIAAAQEASQSKDEPSPDSKLDSAQQFRELLKNKDIAPGEPFAYYTQISIEMRRFGTVVFSAMMTLEEARTERRAISCGIIVGYSYEGHTYDLAKPKIMVIPALPEPSIPKDDSGYDLKQDNNYAVWLVDKLDECMEFELNQGFVEQIILDANLPGKRSPNMYVGRMMTSHRSGRLNE